MTLKHDYIADPRVFRFPCERLNIFLGLTYGHPKFDNNMDEPFLINFGRSNLTRVFERLTV
jgi:hypothetical protein